MPPKPSETIAISEFKATCLAVLERVRRTGTSVVVTRRGEPIAEVVPPSIATAHESWLGAMRDTASVVGDLVAPLSAHDWEALASRQLSLPHQDPADRFIAATAQVMGLTLVTADERLLRCGEYLRLANR